LTSTVALAVIVLVASPTPARMMPMITINTPTMIESMMYAMARFGTSA
jgi:hypothetical protein